MKIFKLANNSEADLFSKEFEEQHEKDMEKVRESLFKVQDDMAKKSPVFKKILDSEIAGVHDPIERHRITNDPKSKTRNALLTRHAYQTQEEWERGLLTNPFYQV